MDTTPWSGGGACVVGRTTPTLRGGGATSGGGAVAVAAAVDAEAFTKEEDGATKNWEGSGPWAAAGAGTGMRAPCVGSNTPGGGAGGARGASACEAMLSLGLVVRSCHVLVKG